MTAYTYIKELCSRPTDSYENQELLIFYVKNFDLDFDVWCSDCLQRAKNDIIGFIAQKEEMYNYLPKINLNGKAKN